MKWLARILIAIALLPVVAVAALWLAGERPDHGKNSAHVEINRPAAQVFRYLMEDELVKKWVGGLTEIKPVEIYPGHVGDRLRMVVALGEEKTEMEMLVTGFEENRRIDFTVSSLQGTSEGFYEKSEYLLSELEGKTQLSLGGRSEYYGFLPRLMEPVITWEAQKKLQEDLERLKGLVEAEPVMTSGAR
jgi:uncharacterized protein YndB with AHSA1/START domain